MCILASKLLPLTLSHGTNDTPGHRRGLMRSEHLPWQQTTPISPRVMARQVESLVELPLSCNTTFADFNSVYIDICHHKFQLRWREGGNNPGCPPLCMNNPFRWREGGNNPGCPPLCMNNPFRWREGPGCTPLCMDGEG